MVKINLLSKQELKKKPRISSGGGGGELWIGLFAIIAVLAVIFLTHTNQAGKIKSTQAKIATTENKIAELKDVEEKVEDFKKKNEELQKRIQVIAELEQKRSGPLFVLDSLSSAIPERAWVSQFQSKGQGAIIKGIAWNEFTVADFLESLEASEYFNNVQIKSIQKKEYNNLALRDFEITSGLNFLTKSEKIDEDEKIEQ